MLKLVRFCVLQAGHYAFDWYEMCITDIMRQDMSMIKQQSFIMLTTRNILDAGRTYLLLKKDDLLDMGIHREGKGYITDKYPLNLSIIPSALTLPLQ